MDCMGAVIVRSRDEIIDMSAAGYALVRGPMREPQGKDEDRACDWEVARVFAAATLLSRVVTEDWTPYMVSSLTADSMRFAATRAECAGEAQAARWLFGGQAPYAELTFLAQAG